MEMNILSPSTTDFLYVILWARVISERRFLAVTPAVIPRDRQIITKLLQGHELTNTRGILALLMEDLNAVGFNLEPDLIIRWSGGRRPPYLLNTPLQCFKAEIKKAHQERCWARLRADRTDWSEVKTVDVDITMEHFKELPAQLGGSHRQWLSKLVRDWRKGKLGRCLSRLGLKVCWEQRPCCEWAREKSKRAD